MNTTAKPAESRRHEIKYFINFFEAIPDQEWCTYSLSNYNGQRCALGHTMQSCATTPDTEGICGLFGDRTIRGKGWETVAGINNGNDKRYRQPTPKQRILAALYDLLKSPPTAQPVLP